MRLAAFILTLAIASPVWGQVRATIDGPVVSRPGEKVVLRASSTAEKPSFVWLSSSEDAAVIDYQEFDGGLNCAVWAKQPGFYGFTLVVIGKDAAGDTVITKIRHKLEIVGPGPAPPVPPNPNPPTPPVPPQPTPPAPSVYGLAELAALAPKDAARATVANNFKSIASACAAGTLQHGAPMEAETARRNAAAYTGSPKDAGHPWHAFAVAIGKRLDELKRTGVVSSKESYVAAWREIGGAL